MVGLEYQGGADTPPWNVIFADVASGGEMYFEKKRLPALPWTEADPINWDEESTMLWSRHIRSTMDEWGRVRESAVDTAVQFRTLVRQGATIVSNVFVREPHSDSTLMWSIPALMFEQRVRRAMQAPTAEIDSPIARLYEGATTLVQSVCNTLPDLERLGNRLRAYELSLPQEVSPSTSPF